MVGFLVGLSIDAQRAWLAFHSNFIFTTMLACAGLVLSCIYTIVGARSGVVPTGASQKGWRPGFRSPSCSRSWASSAVAISSSGSSIPIAEKAVWLNPTRVYVTDIAVLGVMALLSVAYLKASTRPTLRGLAESGEGFAKRMAEKWTAGWKGDEEERAIAQARRRCKLAPDHLPDLRHRDVGLHLRPGHVDGAAVVLEPLRRLRAVGRHSQRRRGLAPSLASCTRALPGFEGEVTESRRHDIGKLLFGFSIFWMYLFFAQYIVIYYGNLPEETFFLRDRLGPQFMIDKGYTEQAFALSWTNWDFKWSRLAEGYGWISMLVWLCCWLVPFWVLLGEKPKKTPWIVGSGRGDRGAGLLARAKPAGLAVGDQGRHDLVPRADAALCRSRLSGRLRAGLPDLLQGVPLAVGCRQVLTRRSAAVEQLPNRVRAARVAWPRRSGAISWWGEGTRTLPEGSPVAEPESAEDHYGPSHARGPRRGRLSGREGAFGTLGSTATPRSRTSPAPVAASP